MGKHDNEVVRNVADLVRRAAQRNPDQVALRAVAGGALTWAELDDQVAVASTALLGLGLRAGDRVALQLGNTFDFPVLYFGALRAGLVVVPANPAYTVPELTYLLADSGAYVLVTSSVATIEAADQLRADAPALRHVVVAAPSGPDGTEPLPALLAAAVQGHPAAVAQGEPAAVAQGEPVATTQGGPVAAAQGVTGSIHGGEDLAVLLYTSGTSGRPRGAMLPHRALLANLDQCGAIQPPVVGPDDILLLVLPLCHVYGLNPGLGMVAWAGCTGILVDRFDPAETLALMARCGVTNVPAAPQMYAAWAGQPGLGEGFATVRTALSGAAPLPPATLARFAAAGITVYEGYGLTETAPVLTSTVVGGRAKAGSVGRPIPGVEVVLRDVTDEPVEDDDPGEIVVRGRNLFTGYWPDGSGGPDVDGWFPTGDVAFADDDGDLHLVDRRRELILVSGFNVYPAEVEAVLLGHPAVADVAVIGQPDDRTGETVVAYVVAEPGQALSRESLLEWAARSLARFKLPSVIEFVAELPYSATGKVSKARLRAAAADRARDVPSRR